MSTSSRKKIIVVEDEVDILELLQFNLSREGFKVTTSRDGEDGLQKIRKEAPDLVILDLMLPSIDGIEVCRRMKADPVCRNIPVIILTAKSEESDVILGLGVGADDYITKPFSPKELVARVRAVLRRSNPKNEQLTADRIVRGGVTIDPSRHEVTVDDVPVTFTATEFRLLHFLASHPGIVFTRDHLLSRAIGEDAVVIDRNIDVHIRSIRKKMGPHRDLIETIRGVGYRFSDDRR